MTEMQKKVAVIIPFYRSTLSDYDKIALEQCARVLSGYPLIAVKPHHLTLPSISQISFFTEIAGFDDAYFTSVAGYNRLMLSTEFYQRFLNYEYILIYQLDAFVFKDDLAYWCNQDIDYAGAPWIQAAAPKNKMKAMELQVKSYLYTRFNVHRKGVPSDKQFINKVGNGGFSLRRVKKFYDIATTQQACIREYLTHTSFHYNEDAFWSVEVNRKKRILNIPDYHTALKFAFEFFPERSLHLNNSELPFGCHDWDNYADFWRPVFKRYGYDI